jgi:hypothetical protein
MVPVNSVVGDFKGLNDIPVRSQGTQTIFIRDVGSLEDGADIQTGYALARMLAENFRPAVARDWMTCPRRPIFQRHPP